MDIVNGLIWDAIGGSGGGSTTVEQLNVTANGTYTADAGKAYSPVVVNVSGGGEQDVPDADVMFIDYDGTVLHTYTKDQFLALNALPANPEHDGLTAQGWNWSLANAKAYVTKYGMLDIGQEYVPASGATEIDIDIAFQKTPVLAIGVNGTCTVDWGDGTTPDTLTGTSYATIQKTQHTYANSGSYTIKISGGSVGMPMGGTGSSKLFWGNTSSFVKEESWVYLSGVTSIRFASNVTYISNYLACGLPRLSSVIWNGAITTISTSYFENCYSLTGFVVPHGVKTLYNSAFSACYGIKRISLPYGLEKYGESGTIASYCYSLKRLCIPEGPAKLYATQFASNKAMTNVVIPDTVTDISNAFYDCWALREVTCYAPTVPLDLVQNCYSLYKVTMGSGCTTVSGKIGANNKNLMEVHIKATTPPTLSSATAFDNLPANAHIYVPSASLATYQSASNWSTYASKMVGE